MGAGCACVSCLSTATRGHLDALPSRKGGCVDDVNVVLVLAVGKQISSWAPLDDSSRPRASNIVHLTRFQRGNLASGSNVPDGYQAIL